MAVVNNSPKKKYSLVKLHKIINNIKMKNSKFAQI